MNWIVSPLVVLIIFSTVYKVFELFVRRGERLKILDKIEEIKDVNLSGLNLNLPSFNTRIRNKFLSLRCGLLGLGIGLGLFIGKLTTLALQASWINTDGGERVTRDLNSVLQTSCVCLFGGLALVISYFIERNTERKDKENVQETNTEA